MGMLVLPNHRSSPIIDVALECKVKATLAFFFDFFLRRAGERTSIVQKKGCGTR
jgi:hypothetical protein